MDILKPNVTELVQMVNHCLSAGLINSGRALVKNTLSAIAGDRIDQGSLQRLEISDVRVLLNALYQVMHAAPTTTGAVAHAPAPTKTGFLGGFLGNHSTSVSAPAVAASTVPAATPAPVVSGRAVTGKHILVSLGSRGLVWCGPAKHLTAAPAGTSNSSTSSAAYLKDGSCVVNDATQSATIFVPSLAVNPAEIVHTNGAGDALCAGLLAEIARKQAAAVANNQAVPLLPDMECVQKALFSAHHWLVSK